MTTNYKRISQFLAAAGEYLTAHPQETKFSHALKRVYTQMVEVGNEYQDLLDDIDIEFANEDKVTGSLLYKMTKQGKQYEYTKEAAKARLVKIRQLFVEDRFDITPHLAEPVIKIEEPLLSIFKGIVIKE